MHLITLCIAEIMIFGLAFFFDAFCNINSKQNNFSQYQCTDSSVLIARPATFCSKNHIQFPRQIKKIKFRNSTKLLSAIEMMLYLANNVHCNINVWQFKPIITYDSQHTSIIIYIYNAFLCNQKKLQKSKVITIFLIACHCQKKKKTNKIETYVYVHHRSNVNVYNVHTYIDDMKYINNSSDC